MSAEIEGRARMGSTATTSAEIIWPRPALAGCIFCMIVRDTRGVRLNARERFNFFPASPLACVTQIITGEIHLVGGTEQMAAPWTGARMPPLALGGAQLGPLVSWNPGETYVLTVAFYPDAFAQMTGLDLADFTGRTVAAEAHLPDAVLAPCRRFFEAVKRDGLADHFSGFEDEIEALWSAVRSDQGPALKWLKDWTRSLVARAALSGAGRSARQVARRVKSWTGVSQRDLKSLGHSEELYAEIHRALEKGELDWGDLAAASGFADQAHMIRQMRRHTGFTPEELRRFAPSEEALWGYRLLGQYFERPGTEERDAGKVSNGAGLSP